jgi:hypothetical protein
VIVPNEENDGSSSFYDPTETHEPQHVMGGNFPFIPSITTTIAITITTAAMATPIPTHSPVERPDPELLLELDEGSEDGNDPEPTSTEVIKFQYGDEIRSHRIRGNL